jgi:hypothetical protein
MANSTDWAAWHSPYDDPTSPLSRRLAVVRGHISDWLDATSGPVTVVSACAGDGHDLIGVLESRADAKRVTATLVEFHPRLVERAERAIATAGLEGVTVREGDAGATDLYVGAVPADLVLLCGVFGNISDDDVHRTIETVPQLATDGATVVWTRHTREPDLTPQIRRWFAEVGCEEVSFTAPPDVVFSVGVHSFPGPTQALEAGRQLFRFLR